MPVTTTIFTDIDYDKPGKQVATLNLPHSPHDDAWGVVAIPICVIANGQGPTVILQGGNHGDEYEGPIALGQLIRELDPARVQGRLIIVPAINTPSVVAGQRVSPLDGKNFNRCFPGNAIGSQTEQIVAYVHDTLYPMADAFVDLHSGGSSLNIIPSAILEPAEDAKLMKANAAAVRAYGAPLKVAINNLGDPRTSTSAAVRNGLITVGTEMGGSGTVSLEALQICRRGVHNVLAHLGVLEASAEAADRHDDRGFYGIPGPAGYVYATTEGVFEPFHGHWTEVAAGQQAGAIHVLDDPGRAPEVVSFRHDGIVYGLRQPGRVRRGNCLAVVVAPYDTAA